MKYTFLLLSIFSFIALFITACEPQNIVSNSVKCVSPKDCRSTQDCKFDFLNFDTGICTDRKECNTSADCIDGSLCIESYEIKYCGTRDEFKINEIILSDAIKNQEYSSGVMSVTNNNFEDYYFEVKEGSLLPEGLELTEQGELKGVITADVGVYSFTIVAYNGKKGGNVFYNYIEATKDLTLAVTPANCGMNCPNNSYCNENTNECDCNTGYTGDLCASCDDGYYNNNEICVIKEVCDENSCLEANKSVCNVVNNIIECSCDVGYAGDSCDLCDEGYHNDNGICVINEVCDESSCLETNKGVCNVINGVVECTCDEGSHLNENNNCIINEICDENSCLEENKGVCNDINGFIECLCDEGYHFDENNYCIINEVCDENSCLEENKSICNIVLGAIECSCDAGFYEVGNTCLVAPGIGWCNTQWPKEIDTNNTSVYGRVYIESITAINGGSSDVNAQLCYFIDGDTNSNSTCVDAVYNKDVQNTNRDEYKAELNLTESGVYHYYFQFKTIYESEYKKCDLADEEFDGTDYENNQTYQEKTGIANVNIVNLGNLFISEYIEGKGDDKFIEVYAYNGVVDLTGWKIKLALNDSVEYTNIIELNPIILNSGETFVISNNAATGYVANQESSLLLFNGNDVVSLFDSDGNLVDMIGVLGDDGNFAKDTRLIRKSTILQGNTVYDSNEWLPTNISTEGSQQDNLGTHLITD